MKRALAVVFVGILISAYVTTEAAKPQGCHQRKCPVTEYRLTLEEANTAPATYSQEDSLIYYNGKLYLAVWSSPAKMIRYNSPRTDLTDQTLMTFANDGFHNLAQSMAVANGKIYVTFKTEASPNGLLHDPGRVVIDEVDPDTLAVTTVVNDTTNVTSRVGSNGPTLLVLGGYMYVLTDGTFSTETVTTQSQVLKYNMSGWGFVASANIVGATYTDGHSLQTDGTYLYATGYSTTTWIAKIDPSDMSYTVDATFPADQRNATDDFAVYGGYAWVGFEDGAGKSSISRVSTSDLTSKTRIELGTPSGYIAEGIFAYADKIWFLYSANVGGVPGIIGTIDPTTLAVIQRPAESGIVAPNELVFDGGGYAYIACWTGPAVVARYRVSGHNPVYRVGGAQ